MRTLGIAACLAGFTLSGAGCASNMLSMEQDRIRPLLLKLHDDQIMDNLMRAYCFEPILQLEYKDMTGTVTDTGMVNAGGSQTDTSGAITNMFDYGIEGSRKNQLTITGTPVNDTAAVTEIGSHVVTQNDGLVGAHPKRTVQHTRKNFRLSPGIYQKYVEFVWCMKQSPLEKKEQQLKMVGDHLSLTGLSIEKTVADHERMTDLLQKTDAPPAREEASGIEISSSNLRALESKLAAKRVQGLALEDASRFISEALNADIDLIKSQPLTKEFCYVCDCTNGPKPDCDVCDDATMHDCGAQPATTCGRSKCDAPMICHKPKPTCRLVELDEKPSKSEAKKYHKVGSLNDRWFGIPKKYAVDYLKLATQVMAGGNVNAASGEDSVGADLRLFRLNQRP